MKLNPFSGMLTDIKAIQMPDKKTRTKTCIGVIIFIIIFMIFLFGCDAFISYIFDLLNI